MNNYHNNVVRCSRNIISKKKYNNGKTTIIILVNLLSSLDKNFVYLVELVCFMNLYIKKDREYARIKQQNIIIM